MDKRIYNLRSDPKKTEKGKQRTFKTDDPNSNQMYEKNPTDIEKQTNDAERGETSLDFNSSGFSADQEMEEKMGDDDRSMEADQEMENGDTGSTQTYETNGKTSNAERSPRGDESQTQLLLIQLMGKMNEMKQEMNEKMENNQQEIISMNLRMEEKIESMEERMSRKFYEMRLDYNQLEDKVNLVEEKLEQVQEKSEKVCDHMKEVIEGKIKTTVEYIDTNLSQIQQKISKETNEKINGVEEKIKTNNQGNENLAGKIQIICGGNHHRNTEPMYQSNNKFNGRQNNPHEYLNKLRKVFTKCWTKEKAMVMDENDFLCESIENCLEGHALKWWELVKREVNTWEDFEARFINRFWSRDIQKGVKQKLEIERYHQRGKLNRTDYFIERVLIMKGMIPQPEEPEIVDVLSEHFEQHIQDAKRVQNIRSIIDFEGLLQRIDVEERNNQIKMRNSIDFEKRSTQKEENWRSEKRSFNYQNKYGKETLPKARYDHPYRKPERDWRHRGNFYGNNNYQRNETEQWKRREPYKNNTNEERPVRNQYFERKRYEDNTRNQWNDQRNFEPRRTGVLEERRYQTREQKQVCNIISNHPQPNANDRDARDRSPINRSPEQNPMIQENC